MDKEHSSRWVDVPLRVRSGQDGDHWKAHGNGKTVSLQGTCSSNLGLFQRPTFGTELAARLGGINADLFKKISRFYHREEVQLPTHLLTTMLVSVSTLKAFPTEGKEPVRSIRSFFSDALQVLIAWAELYAQVFSEAP